MKFALVNEERVEARPDLTGQCPTCGQSMVAKCGEARRWHWAHRGRRTCDPWWENETPWHRAWKGHFPTDWQEVVHHAETGEKHIADVKTDRGWVIEFQHSYLKPEERRSREAFYSKLIWVVDGTRRERDRAQLERAWKEGVSVGAGQSIRKVFPEDCALLREWADSPGPVFLDLGEDLMLVWVLARGTGRSAYLAACDRPAFIGSHLSPVTEGARAFDAFASEVRALVAAYEADRAQRRAGPPPLQGFTGYLSSRYRRRGRF